MIIDAHAHLGHDYVFDEDSTEEELLRWHEKCGVDGAVVQPFVSRPYMEDTQAAHDRIQAMCAAHPGRIFGMASINPHFRTDDYEREAERCVNTLRFVGIKITPIAHAANPASKDGRHVFEVARSLGVPVMVHTGNGAPFADPAALLTVAGDFPEIPIVLAHAGTDLLFAQALYLARTHENVFLEPSWLSILNVRKALAVVGPGKVMFSSDHAVNIPVELAKYRTLLEGKELEQVLSGTVIDVFKLPLKKEQA
ncbi:MAG: amidohydrolase family protein [Defluviitaleaceae bacterium]|nr:amidohydrolase family protein [Defluviitaleaceae bacterium]